MRANGLCVAIGSIRPPKVEAVRCVISQIAPYLECRPGNVNYIAREVPSGVAVVPLSIHEIRRGAYNLAQEARRLIEEECGAVDFSIGLEGGLFILNEDSGSSMSMPIPVHLAHEVIEKKLELSKVIDHYAGRDNVRDRDGAFGFLSRGHFSRQQAFEFALWGALAPFYHQAVYRLP